MTVQLIIHAKTEISFSYDLHMCSSIDFASIWCLEDALGWRVY